MRHTLLVVCLLGCPATQAYTEVSVGISIPGLSIGVNMPAYPDLVLVPGYPVYYAPAYEGNYFFYDGMYWVYSDDVWYSSYWYNGPWDRVYPEYVPLFILRIPVFYYRRPPVYFRAWRPGEPPHWGERWGRDWERHRPGWNRWSSVPAPAPLPEYQRDYSGDHYPSPDRQRDLHRQHYQYRPHDTLVRPIYRRQEERGLEPGRQDLLGGHREEQRPVDFPAQRLPGYDTPQPGTPVGPRHASPQWQREHTPAQAYPGQPMEQRNEIRVQERIPQPQMSPPQFPAQYQQQNHPQFPPQYRQERGQPFPSQGAERQQPQARQQVIIQQERVPDRQVQQKPQKPQHESRGHDRERPEEERGGERGGSGER